MSLCLILLKQNLHTCFFWKQKHLLDGNLAGHLAGRVFTTPRPGLVQPAVEVEPRFVNNWKDWWKLLLWEPYYLKEGRNCINEVEWSVTKIEFKYKKKTQTWREHCRRKSFPPGQIQLDRFPEGDHYLDLDLELWFPEGDSDFFIFQFQDTIVVPWRWSIFRSFHFSNFKIQLWFPEGGQYSPLSISRYNCG